MRPGGALIVCDDVRGEDDSPAAQKAIERFVRGWHVNALLTSDRLRSLAEDEGFHHESDRAADAVPRIAPPSRPGDRGARRAVRAAAVALDASGPAHRRHGSADLPRERVGGVRPHRLPARMTTAELAPRLAGSDERAADRADDGVERLARGIPLRVRLGKSASRAVRTDRQSGRPADPRQGETVLAPQEGV